MSPCLPSLMDDAHVQNNSFELPVDLKLSY